MSYLVNFRPLAGESIPQNDSTLIVAAGQKALVIAAPADTAVTKKVDFESQAHTVTLSICAFFTHSLDQGLGF